jgi:pimeloyl-ACP methyl ester carboxylesterase
MTDSIQSQTGYVDVEGGQIYYEVAGEGHPLVLIHAGVAHLDMWDYQWEAFTRRYSCIRYDTRGFGRSKTDSEEVSFSNRQDIYDLLTHLGVDKTYVMGVSRGGQIATDFTLEHPEMVEALIPVAAGLSGHDGGASEAEIALFTEAEKLWEAKDFEKLADMEVRMWADGPGQPEGRAARHVREHLREMILFNYTNQTIEGKPRVLDPPAAGRLSEIKVPTLVIVGDLDFSDVTSAADAMAEGIPGAKEVVIPGTAHMINMEQPEEFTRIVLDFLGSLDK